jgi:branched-chain amino acid transport system substrate-binding protein
LTRRKGWRTTYYKLLELRKKWRTLKRAIRFEIWLVGHPREGAMKRLVLLLTALLILPFVAVPAVAQKKYNPGASDTEIKIGNTNPYSGPASAYGMIGKTIAAYFNKVNAEGGINGRKITFISYDDGYSPPKTVEQARKLVESDEVLLIFQSLGTANNTAIQRYMNTKKVPQLFIATGATKFGDPQNFPWTMGWLPSYQDEARVYAKYLIEHHPNGKIGVLYQNDDLGKDYLRGMRDGLGGKIPIVSEQAYEATDPTVSSQIISLQGSGADIFFDVTTPKFAAQAISKVADLGWKPVHLLSLVSNSVGAVFKPAGFENSKGVLTAAYLKDPTDPTWKSDSGFIEWSAFMDKYFPEGDRASSFTVYGYSAAQTLVQVLRQCGDDLSRENVMRQAANLSQLELPMLLPGITVNTGPKDYFPIKQLQMQRFNGTTLELFGPVISGEGSS